MGIGDIIGGVKDKILGRNNNEDLDDIKSYVTGANDQYGQSFRENVMGAAEQANDTPPKPWERENIATDPFGSEQPLPDRRDLTMQSGRPSRTEANYDIMEKLTMIESQLAAIRSQTETINERLKNLEFRMGTGRRF
ncbi:MAG: hypothetical protein HY364_03810 [Candidatus Aenigmarchaeota archaeon]|nr:hypothetical protein [Candidatus Aenigmarchaeota archaeon]